MKVKLLSKVTTVVAVAYSILTIPTALAGDREHRDHRAYLTCPDSAIVSMDTAFGDGTSAVTTCLQNRTDVKTVVNVSAKDYNPKKGVSQQLNNVQNMYNNYESKYGMVAPRDYEIKVVVHGFAGKFLLNDAVFAAQYPAEAVDFTDPATGLVTKINPTGKLVRDLINHGIAVYMCQNTMTGNNWKTANLIPGVQEVPGGVTAAIDFAMQGYTLITP